MSQLSKKQLTNSNFGKWGWSMIIYSVLLYYFWAGLAVDGLNVYPSAFAAMHGWDYNTRPVSSACWAASYSDRSS